MRSCGLLQGTVFLLLRMGQGSIAHPLAIVVGFDPGGQAFLDAGAVAIDGGPGLGPVEGAVGVVLAHFRPEFINRLDEIVVFRALDKSQIQKIARIQTEYLGKRLAERQLRLEISDKAIDLIADSGFDPVYGARPLKRAIQQQIENPLARRILEGAFQPGDTIRVDAEQGRIVFSAA